MSFARPAKINAKFLIILTLVLVVLGAGAFVSRMVWRNAKAARALSEGTAAYEKQEWNTARRRFRDYLERNPKDAAVLRKYADCLLRVDSQGGKRIAQAAGVLREVLALEPDDRELYAKLADLYTYLGDAAELAYVARQRLDQSPEDPAATVWMARSLLRQDKAKKARELLEPLVDRIASQAEHQEEFVNACLLLDLIDRPQDAEPESVAQSPWLERAVASAPNSPLALAARAGALARAARKGGPAADSMLRSARRDLEKAESLKPSDPRTLLEIAAQWTGLGEPKRTLEILQSIRQMDREDLREYFVQPNEGLVRCFLLGSPLLLREGKIDEAVAQAEDLLGSIKAERTRFVLLPVVVQTFCAAGRVEQASEKLQEYQELRKRLAAPTEDAERAAQLEAFVALASDEPGRAVAALEPLTLDEAASPRTWELIGEAYAREGQAARAVTALRRCLSYEPDNARVQRMVARQELARGQWKAADAAARKAAEAGQLDLPERLLAIEAQIGKAAGLPADGRAKAMAPVLQELSSLEKSEPSSQAICVLRARAMIVAGQREPAIDYLKTTVARFPKSVNLRLQLAGLYMLADSQAAAEMLCRQAREVDPKDPRPWQALARLLWTANKRAEALQTLRDSQKAVPLSRQQPITLLRAAWELVQGDPDACRKVLQDRADKAPRDTAVRSMLLRLPSVREDRKACQALIDQIRAVQGHKGRLWRVHQADLWLSQPDWRDRADTIVKALEQWRSDSPDWSYPSLCLARVYRKLGKPRDAERACRRAMAVNDSDPAVADLLASLLLEQHRYEEAGKILGDLGTNLPSRLGRKLQVALGQGDVTRAMADLEARVTANPNDANAHLMLAQLIATTTRDIDRAMKHIDAAAAISPESPAPTAVKVALLEREGRREEARQILDKRVARQKGRAALLLRAGFLQKIGDLQAAEKDYLHLSKLPPHARGQELLAGFYRSCGRFDDAIATLASAHEASPDDTRLSVALLALLTQRNAKQDAKAARAILSDLPDSLRSPTLLRIKATWALRRKQEDSIETARALLHQAVAAGPTDVASHLALVDLEMLARQQEAARAAVANGLKANPGNTALLLTKARLELSLGRTPQAVEAAGKILDSRQPNTTVLATLTDIATAAQDQGLLQKTLAAAEKTGALRPRDYRPRVLAARLLLAMGRRDQARRDLAAWAQTPPGRKALPVALFLAGLHRTPKGNQDWDTWVRRAEALAPNDSRVLSERIRYLQATGNYPGITALLEKHGDTDPAITPALLFGASALAAAPDPAHQRQAVDLFEKAVKTAPNAIAPKLGLAAAALQVGEAARAEAAYRKILTQAPENQRALNGLAWILATEKKQYAEALKLADKAVTLDPKDKHARDTRGVILSNLPGRLKDAREDFEQCLALTPPDDPRRAKYLLRLAKTCRKMGDVKAAREHIEQAIESDRKTRGLTAQQRKEATVILKEISATAPPDPPATE